jgi:hypothetical protein
LSAGLDLDAYRARAEEFCEELSREHYLHLAGHKPTLDIEPIYERHPALFDESTVKALRDLVDRPAADEERRRLRHLLHFAVDGLLGQATKAETAELARLEVELEVSEDGTRVPYRAVPVEQANEPDGDRRARLSEARDELLEERLNPLYGIVLERSHALTRELGWPGYAAAYAELRGVDLHELSRQSAAFLEATDESYERLVGPALERAGLPPLGELRRSDVPRLFRATELDPQFPAERLVGSFAETVGGMGIELARQPNVHLDTESRATKSPRAFCSTPRVPDEVYLVIAPIGGRDDYAAFFHEGGHAEHYANTDPALPFEFRHLGDNAVTESFAFLMEHLVDDQTWLERILGAADPERAIAHSRARDLVLLRRYAAKISYELELHGPDPDLGAMPGRYAELLGGATRVRWPSAGWMDDVDGGFYVACYLRAWALESRWRSALRERWGERWFASREAGEWLVDLWRGGQRLGAGDLAQTMLGANLDFTDKARDFA